MKSSAPFFIVVTAIGTSPWPVMKVTGSGERALEQPVLQLRPLMPSMRMSAIRQATSRGSKRDRNDSAESKHLTR